MKDLDRFKAIRFVVRFGYLLPWLAALLAVVVMWVGGGFAGAGGLACAAIAVALAWGGVRLAVEMVDLVAESLLPR